MLKNIKATIYLFLLSLNWQLFGQETIDISTFTVYWKECDNIVAKLNEPIDIYIKEYNDPKSPVILDGLKLYFDKKSRTITSIHITSNNYCIGDGIKVGDKIDKVKEEHGNEYFLYSSDEIDSTEDFSNYDSIYVYYLMILADMGYSLEFDTKNGSITRIIFGIASGV